MFSNIDPAVLIVDRLDAFYYEKNLEDIFWFDLEFKFTLVTHIPTKCCSQGILIVCKIQPSHSLRLQQRATITELDFLFLSRWQ